jgi:hypothetical protein
MDNQNKCVHQQTIYELNSQGIPKKWQLATFDQLIIPNNLNTNQRENYKLELKKSILRIVAKLLRFLRCQMV